MVGDITQMTQILKLDNCNNSLFIVCVVSVVFSKIPKSHKTT